MDPDLVCIICNNSLIGDTVVVTKGLKTITEASLIRGDGLHKKIEGRTSVKLHKVCRQNYTRPTSIKAAITSLQRPDEALPSTSSPVLRNLCEKFDFKTNCFICEQRAVIDLKSPLNRRKEIRMVATLEIQINLLHKCDERNDEWGDRVRTILLSVSDLVAPEARYHKQCHDTFCKTNLSEGSVGRPKTDEDNFFALCKTIEDSDECQFTVKQLQDIMTDLSGKTNTYSDRHLKYLLKEHFKDRIIVSNVSGRKNIVSLSDTAHKIFENWYKGREQEPETERLRIVLAAADIIKEDIQKMVYDYRTYPDTDDIRSGGEHLIPNTLSTFTRRVIEKKCVTEEQKVNQKGVVINHAIISAVRPRSFLSPLQCGLALTLHRLYGSRHLVDMLSSMGVCASYYEATTYNNSLISAGSPKVLEGAFVQHVFDNADVNIRTLDGLNTFHAMGGIQCIAPAVKVDTEVKVERQYSGTFNPESIRKKVYAQTTKRKGLSKINIKDYNELLAGMCITDITITLFPLNYIWMSSVHVQPGWNGFMNIINSKTEDSDSTYIKALPFINMDASNYSTIFTALCFAAEESRKQNQSCIITFDQPLFLKASEIVASAESQSEISKIVVRLGGFHLLMSFMGSVGQIMEESGLESLWATVYGQNAVKNMLSGHSYARCIRAFMLTASALINALKDHDEVLKESVSALEKYHSQVGKQEINIEQTLTDPEIIDLCSKIDNSLKSIESSNRTSKLWINLIKCTDLILQFIYAERTGNWDMHLATTIKMLPYFHAAGHLPYAKSAHLYVQEMLEINLKLTEREFELFTKKGMFTVRRSGKFWSGTWTDMCIEQCLMRPMKSVGGLTHGRGITESTLTKWINGTPYFLKIHEALEDFLGSSITFSEQHVEVRDSRKKRDQCDLQKFTSWILQHNPFNKVSGELVSLSSGYVSDESVNCDQAYEIGIAAMNKMSGKNFGELHLHRKDKVQTQAKSKKVKVRSNEVLVNPQQLFNRILCVCDSPMKLKEYMSYELASRPPSIFDEVSLRKGTKSSLMKVFEAGLRDEVDIRDAVFVVDGGFLLHYMNWPNKSTYGGIIKNYCDFVISNYGNNATVVFDGYPENPTTKSEEQRRRASKKTSCDINFDESTECTTPKENLLGNKKNKTKLLHAIASKMTNRGISTLTAEEDADVLIVNVAIKKAKEGLKVVVVGTDTDLCALLVALAPEKNDIYFCKPTGGKDGIKLFYDIGRLIEQHNGIRKELLFVHAMTGCDTTSSFYGIGKIKAVEMLKSSLEAKQQASTYLEENILKEELLGSGENFTLGLYGMNKHKNLNEARYFKFASMAKKSNLRSNFNLAKLPPTSEACQQHLLRVYLQVQVWLGNTLNATQWGWKMETVKGIGGNNKILQPVTSLKPFAPIELLLLVSCACKSTCGNYCGCRKSGLFCSGMCENCNGVSCHNIDTMNDEQEQDTIEDD